MLEVEYQSGFGNHFTSEAVPGALPRQQNNPLLCPLGLYAEQLSGTSFTSPRHLNQCRFLFLLTLALSPLIVSTLLVLFILILVVTSKFLHVSWPECE